MLNRFKFGLSDFAAVVISLVCMAVMVFLLWIVVSTHE